MEQRKMKFPIGGIILLIMTALAVLSKLFNFVTTLIAGASISIALQTLLTQLLIVVPHLVFAVMMVMKKHGKTLMIAAIIMLACRSLGLIGNISQIIYYARFLTQDWFYPVSNLLVTLAWCASCAGVMLLCMKSYKDPAGTKMLKLLPPILYAAGSAMGLLSMLLYGQRLFGYTTVFQIINVTTSLVSGVIYTVVWFLVCGWIADPYEKQPVARRAAYPTQYPPQYQPQQGYQAPQYPPQQPQYPQYPQQTYPPQNQNPYQNQGQL